MSTCLEREGQSIIKCHNLGTSPVHKIQPSSDIMASSPTKCASLRWEASNTSKSSGSNTSDLSDDEMMWYKNDNSDVGIDMSFILDQNDSNKKKNAVGGNVKSKVSQAPNLQRQFGIIQNTENSERGSSDCKIFFSCSSHFISEGLDGEKETLNTVRADETITNEILTANEKDKSSCEEVAQLNTDNRKNSICTTDEDVPHSPSKRIRKTSNTDESDSEVDTEIESEEVSSESECEEGSDCGEANSKSECDKGSNSEGESSESEYDKGSDNEGVDLSVFFDSNDPVNAYPAGPIKLTDQEISEYSQEESIRSHFNGVQFDDFFDSMVSHCETDSDDEDFCMSCFSMSVGVGYAFPRVTPRRIEQLAKFWEHDFQVGNYVYPKMASWESKELAPNRNVDPIADCRKYAAYKKLYTKWLESNKSQEQWYNKYRGYSLVDIANGSVGISGVTKQKTDSSFKSACSLDIATQCRPQSQRLRRYNVNPNKRNVPVSIF